jgi:dTDP-4-dehydrorhamnose reductase
MNAPSPRPAPAIWGGIECSIVRIRDGWRDQLAETGHAVRLDDLDAVAALGIRTLRYPVLWESVSPVSPDQADFGWHDRRLARLRDLGIEVIAGLVHHGSGPRYTSLVDPAFPDLLARHAERVARRYPWLRCFTPVNEPLTTARFSGLYGHWYPHRRDVRVFARALVNQCRAVAHSMRAIRSIRPDAQLIQTEDLGKVFASPAVAYQADYENERRWLTFDLLLGRVDRSHPWFARLVGHGIDERTLLEFVDEPCPPDVVGINHYLTSDRFLEHRRGHWPAGQRSSGNGRHRYADLEAVRADLPAGATGPEARLREAWRRYGERPIAVTEVHHGCSRDEQMRWLGDVWGAARTLAGEGAPIRAVTAWALFGCLDWNSLLLRRDGSYEPGAFDIRSREPRLTALGQMVRTLAAGGEPAHPVLSEPGWWRRDLRFYRPPSRSSAAARRDTGAGLLIGGGGALAQTLARVCEHRGLHYTALDGAAWPPDAPGAARLLGLHRPWAVLDATAVKRVGENDAAAGLASCTAAAMAAACAERDLPFLSFSSDALFDGRQPRAFAEDDRAAPLTLQGRSRADEEDAILAGNGRALIVRTSAPYGPWDAPSSALRWLATLASGRPIRLPGDLWCSPTYRPDLAHAVLDLLIDGETGIWHLINDGRTTWHGFGVQMAEAAGLDGNLVLADPSSGRLSAALSSNRGRIMPSMASGLERFIGEVRRAGALASARSAAPAAPTPVPG